MSLQAPLVQRQLTRLLLKSDGICWTIRPPATAAAMASAALTDTEFRSQLQPEGKRIGFRMSSKNKLEDVGGSNGSPLFSVMIVNYNGGDYLQNCISSLAQQTFRDFEVICIDNASSDGSVDVLDTEGVPNFTLSRQSENLGFARGNNVAATQARGRWLALLNPDAIADPYWLQKIFEASERHTACLSFRQASFQRRGCVSAPAGPALFTNVISTLNSKVSTSGSSAIAKMSTWAIECSFLENSAFSFRMR